MIYHIYYIRTKFGVAIWHSVNTTKEQRAASWGKRKLVFKGFR